MAEPVPADLDALRAAAAARTHLLIVTTDSVLRLCDELEDARQRVTELQAALRVHGVHLNGCPSRWHSIYGCTCGLAALAGARPEEEKSL